MKTISRLVCLIAIAALSAVAFADGMTLKQVARLQAVGDALVSPDGARIAFTRYVPRKLKVEKDGGSWVELHVIGPDGESRPFVSGQVSVSDIGWTPDSRRITFRSERDGDDVTRLYAVPVDGGEARPLTDLKVDVQGYSLSPDGRRAAIIATEPDPEDLKKEREMGFSQVVFEEDWKPRNLYVVDLPADGPVTDLGEPLPIDGSVQEALWSPAGDRLAVTVTPRQLVDDTLMFKRVRIVSPEGREFGRVENPGKLGRVAWSPNGERLALVAAAALNETTASRLMVAGKSGGRWTTLLDGLQGDIVDVGWQSADTVAYICHEGVEARVGVIGHDGRGDRTVLAAGGPIWESISVSRDGRMALTAHAPDHPMEAYGVSRGGRAAERLTNSNPWLADVELARQEVVRYSARDGLMIEGILFYPLDYRAGQRYPLILTVHGGPEAHYSNGWLTRYSAPVHHASAEGYFTFFPNYRGSTGRGVEFALSSQGRPSEAEFDDLVDGVDFLIEEGLVDGDRVGITGGSYGGYASAWGATYYSERFAAAVMFVGISEMISKLGTSDIAQEMHSVHYRKWPWEDWAMFDKSSPLRYVTRAKTPILIMHGDSDPRVDPTQSRILYRYLSLQDDPPPVRLVLYKGEGHGNRRAASRYDYSLRFMRWMNHYLKGEGGDPPPYRLDYDLDEDSDDS